MMIENKNKVEAIAWEMKYFRAASEAIIFFVSLIRGIIEIKLISSPIHIPSQVLDLIEINVPITRDLKNIGL